MKVKTPERGEIVESVQGRDKGCFYVVCEVRGNSVLVADGVKRKLAKKRTLSIFVLRRVTPRKRV